MIKKRSKESYYGNTADSGRRDACPTKILFRRRNIINQALRMEKR